MRVDLFRGVPAGLAALPPLSPSPAGTYTNPSSLTVNAAGQVTGAAAGAGGDGGVLLLTGGLVATNASAPSPLLIGQSASYQANGTDVAIYYSESAYRVSLWQIACKGSVSGTFTIVLRICIAGTWSTLATINTLTNATPEVTDTTGYAVPAGSFLALNWTVGANITGSILWKVELEPSS